MADEISIGGTPMGLGQILEGLLTGGQRSDYQDFVKRYNEGPPSQGYEVDEVARRYNEIAPALPPQEYQRAAMEAFERMSPQERSEFARVVQQRAQHQNVQVPGFPDLDRNGVDDRMQSPADLAHYTTQVQQQKP